MRGLEKAHLMLAYQTLQGMKEEDDPFSYSQAHHCISLSALCSLNTRTGIAHHEEAVKIVERNGLHIIKGPDCMISDPAHLEASARRAEANCPERAITITDGG